MKTAMSAVGSATVVAILCWWQWFDPGASHWMAVILAVLCEAALFITGEANS